MSDPPPPPDVFEYLSVRDYLRDVYDWRKQHSRSFSYRAFSLRAKLRSPNHLKRVIDGERTLTPEMAVRYAHTLGIDGPAAAWFCDLAAFDRASTLEERNAVYERLRGHRAYRRGHRLEQSHAAYAASWYIPAIRELLLRADFREDPEWIAAQLVPAIRPAEAQEALEVLLQLGLVERREDRLVQGQTVVTTGPETRGLHVRNYHRVMMERAVQSMDLVPAAERDISSLTFCTRATDLPALKARVQQFRKELLEHAAALPEGDQVVQLNIQLFPLSTSRSGTREETS